MFKKDADGIAKKGKTEGKNLGNFTGAKVMGDSGKSAKLGVSSMAMKDMGRNLARVANQKKAGRGR
jgi:hypothetical protein